MKRFYILLVLVLISFCNILKANAADIERAMIAAGGDMSGAIDEFGNVYTWGSDNESSVTNTQPKGTFINSDNPKLVKMGGNNISDAKQLSFGGSYSSLRRGGRMLVLKNDKSIYGTGEEWLGALGEGPWIGGLGIFTKVDGGESGDVYMENVKQVESGGLHSLALLEGGSVYAWGLNDSGQVGNKTSVEEIRKPVKVDGADTGNEYLVGVKQIEASSYSTYAVLENGNVYAWGRGTEGQLGNGRKVDLSWPNRVKGGELGTTYIENVKKIAVNSSGSHVLALLEDGSVYAWGNSHDGNIGNGANSGDITIPVKVRGGATGETYLTGVKDIAVGNSSSYAVLENGNAYAWGRNTNSELGDSTVINRNIPVRIKGGAAGGNYLDGVRNIVAGDYHAVSLMENGDVYSWGRNNNGQLGDGTNINRDEPVRVKGGDSGDTYLRLFNPNTEPNKPIITSPNINSNINDNKPQIAWTFSDPDSGDTQSKYRVIASRDNFATIHYDTGVVTSESKSKTTNVLVDGTWKFRVKVWDFKGDESKWGEISNVQIDTKAPKSTGIQGMQYTKNTTGSLRVNDYNISDAAPSSGINRVDWWSRIMLKGSSTWETWQPHSSGTISGANAYYNIPLRGEGKYEVHRRIYDNAGNRYEPWDVTGGNGKTYFYSDKTIPNYISSTIEGYKHKDGNDYWIKPNDILKVKIRGKDEGAGIFHTNIRIPHESDENRAHHSFLKSTDYMTEFNTSVFTDIISCNRTYNQSGVGEVEWSIKGLKDAMPVYLQYYYKDHAENQTSGYINTEYKLAIDGTNPNYLSTSITGYKYKNGNDYWIKPNDVIKVNIRGNDDGSGIKYSNLRFRYTDDNRATYNFQSNTYSEFNKSVNTSIGTPTITYNSNGEKEVEWEVKGLRDVPLGMTQYYFKDYVENDSGGYKNTGLRLGVDGITPNYVSSSVTGYTYKEGNNYWVKPNDIVKIKIRGNDDESGIWTTNIRLAYADENKAWYSYRTQNKDENDESIYTDITTIDSTYNLNGEKEVEWTVKGLKSVALGDIQYFFRDNVDNKISEYANTGNKLGVDGTKPTPPSINVDSNWQNTDVDFTVTGGSDSGSGISKREYKIGTGEWTTYSETVTISTEGITTVYARTVDNVGLISSEVSKQVKIDKTTPDVIITPNSKAEWTNQNIEITFTPSDNLSGVKVYRESYSMNNGVTYGEWYPNETGISTTILSANGYRKIKVYIEDNAGNSNVVYSGNYYIDKKSPNDFSISKLNENITRTSILFSWDEFNDNEVLSGYKSTYVYAERWNGSDWLNDVNIDGLGEAEENIRYEDISKKSHLCEELIPGNKYRFAVVYEDNAGNFSSYNWKEIWTKPDIPSRPSGTISAPTWHKTEGRGRVVLNWDSQIGATGYNVHIWDGRDYRKFDVGNTTTWDSGVWKIYPAESFLDGYADNSMNVDPFNYTKTGLDLRDTPNKIYKKTLGTAYDERNSYYFRVSAYNSSGNNGYSEAYVPTLPNRTDSILPSGIFTPNSSGWTKNDISVTFNPSDVGSGVKRWRWRTSSDDGSTYSSWSNYINGDTSSSINLDAKGLRKIQVEVLDKVDNVNLITSGSYYIDKDSPHNPVLNDSFSGITDTSITLNWKAFSDSVPTSGYESTYVYAQRWNGSIWVNDIDIDGLGGADTHVVYNDVNKTSHRYKSLIPGNRYRLTVKYRDNAGNWGEYTWKEVWTKPSVPNRPIGTVVGLDWHKTEGRGKVVLNWQKVEGATGYYVYVYDGNDYRAFDAGNNLTWDSSIDKIYPTEETINSYLLNSRTNDIFNHDKNGLDLRDDPSKLYKSSIRATYNNRKNYWFRISAYNSGGNTGYSEAYTPTLPNRTDSLAPTGDGVEVRNLDMTGYDVYVYNVEDTMSGINRVQFPTWTLANGQDDIALNWETNGSVKGINLGSGTWKFRVNISDHANERLDYKTQVYVYDNVGNRAMVGEVNTRVNTEPIINVNDNIIYKKDNQELEISGNIIDPDSDNMIIKTSIGGVEKTTTRVGAGSYTLKWNTKELLEGTYTGFKVSVDDQMGGIEEITYINDVVVDKTKPVGSFAPNSQDVWGKADVAFRVDSSDNGPAGLEPNECKIRYSLNEASTWTDWLSLSVPTYNGFLAPSDGKRITEIKLVDKAGNENIVRSGIYLIDKTKPNLSVDEIEQSYNYIRVNMSAIDNLSGIKDYKIEFNASGDNYSLETLRTYSNLKSNKTYSIKFYARDNVNNVAEETRNITTYAVVPQIDVIDTEKDSVTVRVYTDDRNDSRPEVKVICVNKDKANDFISSEFSISEIIKTTGLAKATNYRVDVVIKSLDGHEERKTILDNILFAANDNDPIIHDFVLNYGDKTTTQSEIDMKLVASDDKTFEKDLKVQFDINGRKYGYDSDGSVWKENHFGDYQTYYGGFKLDGIGENRITATIVDEGSNKARLTKLVTYQTNTSKPVIVEKPIDTGSEVSDILYDEDGRILTRERLVKIEYSSSGDEFAVSKDSVVWSPWEKVKDSTILKYVELDEKVGIVKTVYVRVRDEAKAEGDIKVIYYLLDREGPEVNITTSNNIRIAKDGKVTLKLEAKDNVSKDLSYKITVKSESSEKVIEGKTKGLTSILEPISGLSAGSYSVEVVVKDQLGNEGKASMNLWSK
jgi:alpha-tubulin suppressor-like RCC1 family protein